jgi:type II secretory pathway pseudopilin PulG
LKFFKSDRGDTLVEVVLAIAILGMVLVASFNVANAAFGLGQGAKERTQAANLVQEQAEALRNYRDSHRWNSSPPAASDMMSRLGVMGFATSRFHMQNSGSWNFVGGALQSGLFRVYIVATRDTVDPDDKVKFDITAEWEAIGGGSHTCPSGFVGNCTTISTYLVNLDDFVPGLSGAVGPPPPPPLPPPPPPPCPPINMNIPAVSGNHLYYSYNQQWTMDISSYTAGLPPGCQYRVAATTTDPGHPDDGNEDNERICLSFRDSGGAEIAATVMTDDLPAALQFITTDLGVYIFGTVPTQLVFKHYVACGGADISKTNSIQPYSVTLISP